MTLSSAGRPAPDGDKRAIPTCDCCNFWDRTGCIPAVLCTPEAVLSLQVCILVDVGPQVTIPPPGWINAAHMHGVRVLGTLITEWEAGAAACAELFGSPEAAADAAEALARIAACYGLEGWLINIENEVPPGHIPNLLHFLR